MEYTRSKDQHWHLKVPSNEPFCGKNDDEITSELGKLRTKMENKDLVLGEPCVLSIPCNCFFPSDKSKPVVKILDLPGLDARNPDEEEHVLNMARRYVPLADLILLVGRIDSLSFLKPSGLSLPGIDDWQSVPARFRIVTTYSFTAESMRNLMRQHGKTADIQFFRQKLIEQIETFTTLSEHARKSQLYFPLEFGDSWVSAGKESNQDWYSHVSRLIDELKCELHQDIQKATKPEARFKNAVDAHVVITQVKKNRLEELKNHSDQLHKAQEQSANELSQYQLMAEKKKDQHRILQERLQFLNNDRLTQDLANHFVLSGSTTVGNPCKKVSWFLNEIEIAKESLKSRIQRSQPDCEKIDKTDWLWLKVITKAKTDFAPLPKEISNAVDSVFANFERHLKIDHLTDSYWPSISKNYKSDLSQLNNSIQTAEQRAVELARSYWFEAAKKILHEQEKKLQSIQYQVELWSERIKDAELSLEQEKKQIANHCRICKEFQERMDQDLKESKRFIEILDQEYLIELDNRYQRISKTDQPAYVFIDLLAINKLIHTRQKILH